MKRIRLEFVVVFFLWFAILPSVHAAFTSMQVFGDGLSTVTNNVSPGTNYYGNRYCNGRVWVEVLAERQGLILQTNQNLSFYGHYSSNLVANASNYVAQPDVGTTLFVVWVNNADIVYDISFFNPYTSNNIATWTNANNRSVSNHARIVEALYAKGARTIVLPPALDITKAPVYNIGTSGEDFIRQQVIAFNDLFTNRMNQLQATLPGLKIITPDFFTFVDDLIAHPTNYALTNSTSYALLGQVNKTLNGPGTNYVFWDNLNPSARVQEIFADMTQALLSAPYTSAITRTGGSNQLAIANAPIGLAGIVEGTTNFQNWSSVQNFETTNSTQTIQVPMTGTKWFYRLRFPFVWSWP